MTYFFNTLSIFRVTTDFALMHILLGNLCNLLQSAEPRIICCFYQTLQTFQNFFSLLVAGFGLNIWAYPNFRAPLSAQPYILYRFLCSSQTSPNKYLLITFRVGKSGPFAEPH